MEKQIKLFAPQDDELDGLDSLIQKVPELSELIEESGNNLQTIVNGVKSLKGLKDSYKTMIIDFFRALCETHTTKEVYKYSNFKNQEIIEILLEREKELKKIIKNQALKHNDNEGEKEMENMFNTMIIKTKNNISLSDYMNKKIKDIKFYDNYKPLFKEEGIQEYTKKELLKMKKKDGKGPQFRNIESITVVNIPKNKNYINGKFC